MSFLAGKNATFTLGGINLKIIDGSINDETASDDMTNNQSAGWFQPVGTIQKITIDVTVAADTSIPQTFNSGSTQSCSSGNGTFKSFSGSAFIDSINYKSMDVKGGYKYSIKATNDGAWTIT